MRTLGGAFAVAGILALAACQTSQPFAPEPPRDPDNALVHVYWPAQTWREKSGSAPEVQVDGVPVGMLRYKTYLRVELKPGRHEFRLTGASEEADWAGADQAFEQTLAAGQTAYVRLLVKYDQQKNTWQNPGMSYVVQFLPRGEAEARAEMAELRPASDR